MQRFSYLQSSNAEYIDEVFQQYLKDPSSVDESWKWFFEGLELGASLTPHTEDGAPLTNGQAGPVQAASSTTAAAKASSGAPQQLDLQAEAKVAELIQAYRERGKLLAHIDPLNGAPASHPSLELQAFGLSNADLARVFHAGKLMGLGPVPLSEILDRLKATYCGTIAAEFTHVSDPERRQWLISRMESAKNRDPELTPETRRLIHERLAATEGFERFLHTRYVAQKRFSIEGGDAAIPALDCIIERGAELGADELVMGMAHRGRLNVLAHVFGKPHAQIFTEFEGTYSHHPGHGEGDVKYHKGASRDLTTRHGKPVHLSLMANPSHLEVVNPVVEGSARARQDRKPGADRKRVIPVEIHGDAAFAGQGVCYETLQMQSLAGYSTGGTIHLIINNQVGFTTSPVDSRSTPYCTDLAKAIEAPVLHVNGNDPEAAWWAARLAVEWRQKFGTAFFIDLVCYRKHGHNEGDEPAFTQPAMYKKIKALASPRELHAARLAAEGVLSEAEATAVVDAVTARLTEAQKLAKAEPQDPQTSVFEGHWKGLRAPGQPNGKRDDDWFRPVATAVGAAALKDLAAKINAIPAGFHLHSKLGRFFEARLKAVEEGKGIDWGNGEALAFATLLAEGHPVRLSGQDAERGTFTHRHAVLSDSETGERRCPLSSVAKAPAAFHVHNSHLSETAVLGFEYGYSLSSPGSLVIWEAQFGDFANGAQIIIDQFIATGESKWRRMNGVTLLLPHGYEGQGPEHSSARLERFLQLCAHGNMAVANLTTPAQLFHALRRQVKRDFRKPLVIMSPKSMLRHPQAVSTLDEFTGGGFQELIDDPAYSDAKAASGVKRVLLCSGKVYYDLVAARNQSPVAIVRVEQLYPWPVARLSEVLARYPQAKELMWVQEEPRNMGAWPTVQGIFADDGRAIRYVGRPVSCSPAAGSPKVHDSELKAFLKDAFT